MSEQQPHDQQDETLAAEPGPPHATERDAAQPDETQPAVPSAEDGAAPKAPDAPTPADAASGDPASGDPASGDGASDVPLAEAATPEDPTREDPVSDVPLAEDAAPDGTVLDNTELDDPALEVPLVEEPEGAAPAATATGDLVEIARLADALDHLDAGGVRNAGGGEDAELDRLLDVAAAIGRPLTEATEQRSFRSFHHRSRAAIVHLLEEDLASDQPRPVAHGNAQAQSAALIPRPLPQRRAGVASRLAGRLANRALLAPVAAAAAVVAITVSAFAGGLLDRFDSSPAAPGAPDTTAENLTPRTTADELSRIAMALTDIRQHSERGESVSAPLLREVAEGTARVANAIDLNPETVDPESVENYNDTVRESETVLDTVEPEPDAEDALHVARSATRDGAVVASRYLDGLQPPDAPESSSDETSADTGSPAATPVPSGTVTATGAPDLPVPSPEDPPPDPTASPSPTADPFADPGEDPEDDDAEDDDEEDDGSDEDEEHDDGDGPGFGTLTLDE